MKTLKIGLVVMMPATVTSRSGKIMKQDTDACKRLIIQNCIYGN